MLSVRECLVRKVAVISKVDEKLLENIEDENKTAAKIDAAKKFQNFVSQKGIEIEQFFARIEDERIRAVNTNN